MGVDLTVLCCRVFVLSVLVVGLVPLYPSAMHQSCRSSCQVVEVVLLCLLPFFVGPASRAVLFRSGVAGGGPLLIGLRRDLCALLKIGLMLTSTQGADRQFLFAIALVWPVCSAHLRQILAQHKR